MGTGDVWVTDLLLWLQVRSSNSDRISRSANRGLGRAKTGSGRTSPLLPSPRPLVWTRPKKPLTRVREPWRDPSATVSACEVPHTFVDERRKMDLKVPVAVFSPSRQRPRGSFGLAEPPHRGQGIPSSRYRDLEVGRDGGRSSRCEGRKRKTVARKVRELRWIRRGTRGVSRYTRKFEKVKSEILESVPNTTHGPTNGFKGSKELPC